MWDKLAGKEQVVKSAGEMRELAQIVAEELEVGDVLLLRGPLGSGKTTFVQSLAEVLGVTDQITSPTFTVVAEYAVGGSLAIERLVHVDLYRLGDEEAQKEMSVAEVLEENKRKNAVTIIEWAEKLGDEGVAGAKGIEFKHGESENERRVRFIN